MSDDKMRPDCEGRFSTIEAELSHGSERFIFIQNQLEDIRSIVSGKGNGSPGINEQLRFLQREISGVKEDVSELKNRGWKRWEKVAGILLILIALASLISKWVPYASE